MTPPDDVSYRIVPTSWHDLRAIRRLDCAVFPRDAYPWYEILALLILPGTVNFKAVTARGQLVGHVAGDPRPSQGVSWIVTIAVDPAHQRRGLGGRLLRACEDALPTSHIRLTVRVGNASAIAFYQKRGYRERSVWHGYYRDGEDGIIMGKNKEASIGD